MTKNVWAYSRFRFICNIHVIYFFSNTSTFMLLEWTFFAFVLIRYKGSLFACMKQCLGNANYNTIQYSIFFFFFLICLTKTTSFTSLTLHYSIHSTLLKSLKFLHCFYLLIYLFIYLSIYLLIMFSCTTNKQTKNKTNTKINM